MNIGCSPQADEGYPVPELSAQLAAYWDVLIPRLLDDPAAAAVYLDGDFDLSTDGLWDYPATVGESIGNGASNTLHRLSEGIERFLIADINNPAATARAQSEIPIMWDCASPRVIGFNHVPGGANTLHLDGHVEFVRFPSTPPMNVAAIYAQECWTLFPKYY